MFRRKTGDRSADTPESIWVAFVRELYLPGGKTTLHCTDGSKIQLTTASCFKDVFGGRKHIVAEVDGRRYDIVAKLALLTCEELMRTFIGYCCDAKGMLSAAKAVRVFQIANQLSYYKMLELDSLEESTPLSAHDTSYYEVEAADACLGNYKQEDDFMLDNPITAIGSILAFERSAQTRGSKHGPSQA